MRASLIAFSFICMSLFAKGQSSGDDVSFSMDPRSDRQAGKFESAGNYRRALSALLDDAGELDRVSTKYPSWNPLIVSFRKDNNTIAIARVLEKMGYSESGRTIMPLGFSLSELEKKSASIKIDAVPSLSNDRTSYFVGPSAIRLRLDIHLYFPGVVDSSAPHSAGFDLQFGR